MVTVDDLLRRIRASDEGPEIAAFFDYDGTVITGYSAEAFYWQRLLALEVGPSELGQTIMAAARGIRTADEFAAFLELSLPAWKHKTEEEVMLLGERLFRDEIAGRLHLEIWQLAEAHRAKGHRIVLASSATPYQVNPMARELGAEHVLCTRLEVEDGRFTGRLASAAPWGAGKAAAVVDLALREGIDLDRSFAYANGDEDVPFLAEVGRAVAVSPAPGLEIEAGRRGWPVLRCQPRGGSPGLTAVARTAAFYGGMAAAFTTAAGLFLLHRSRRRLVDFTGTIGCELGLALAGVEVEVQRGEEHLWSARPCVFVFNHQSKIDPILIGKILRGGFTGVAKKEAASVPGFGQFFRLAGVAFVDRGNIAQAKEALAPAVAKIRSEGLSLAISPEGTRSPTPRLGPFKKGAFHIAMQARVPMVPIVIRNAGEVMWRSAQAIHAGKVEIVVLPPIDTGGWTRATLDRHVQEVRDQFVTTLADWPRGKTRNGRPRDGRH